MKKPYITRTSMPSPRRRRPIGVASAEIAPNTAGMPALRLVLESVGGVRGEEVSRWLSDNVGRRYTLVAAAPDEARRLTFEAQLEVLLCMLKTWPIASRREWAEIAIGELRDLIDRDRVRTFRTEDC